MLQIYVEPFKLFTKCESAVKKAIIKNLLLSDKNQHVVEHKQLTPPWLVAGEGQVGGYEIFVSGEGVCGL